MPLIAGMLLTISTDSIGDDDNGFRNDADEPIDPTVVLLKVAVNGATPTTYTYGDGSVIVKDSVGNYHAELDSTGLAGVWVVEWIGDPDGTVDPVCQSINWTAFQVQPAPL